MKKITVLVIFIVVFLLSANNALACVCEFALPAQDYDRAQVVFTGKVIKAKKSAWTIIVDRVWKGEIKETVVLRDFLPKSSCSASFKKEVSYLFLVNVVESKGKTVYYPQVCSWGNTRLNKYRVEVGGNNYMLIEDIVLRNRGEGYFPLKNTK